MSFQGCEMTVHAVENQRERGEQVECVRLGTLGKRARDEDAHASQMAV